MDGGRGDAAASRGVPSLEGARSDATPPRPLCPAPMFTSRRSLLTLAALALLMAAAAACTSSRVTGVSDERAALEAARARWAARDGSAYSWVYQRDGCECLPEWTRPLYVEVTGAGAVTVLDEATRQPPQHFGDIEAPTVEYVFDLIDDAIALRAHRLTVEYDATHGFPLLMVVDYDEIVADDEFRITGRAYTRR